MKYNVNICPFQLTYISNRSWKYEGGGSFKALGNLFYKKKHFWCFLRYQYLYNYNKIFNITYPNTRVFVQAKYWYPFYVGFYQYVCR